MQKSLALASAWFPRGELSRFEKLFPAFEKVYRYISISLPPETEERLITGLRGISDGINVVITPDWSWGRYAAMQKALESPATHMHYADFDRLLRWVETRPKEWRQTTEVILHKNCLIMGRTEAAYRTHPQAMLRTEAISNLVTSDLLGKEMDFSAGSKGFSRQAAEFLIFSCTPGRALGTDAEWPIMLFQAGYEIDYIEVDGLDWEIPDQYQPQAADSEEQSRLAKEYDSNPAHWARRVDVALEIVQAGLDTFKRTGKTG